MSSECTTRPTGSDGATLPACRRLVVHDYAGHPFQVQLSRELARRGHRVLHAYSASYRTGKGAVQRAADDPCGFAVEPIRLAQEFRKYSLWKRPLQDLEYGRALARLVHAFRPDVVLSANNPLLSQLLLLRACRRPLSGPLSSFVFWQQDVHGLAMQQILDERVPVLGGRIGALAAALERRLLKASDAVVTIAEEFAATAHGWGVPAERVHVVENWAPLQEIPLLQRDNEWAAEHDLVGRRVVLYAGTLGLKHNPDVLFRLACRLRGEPDVRVVVVSEGLGADRLRKLAARENPGNLVLLGFQPYDRLPSVLASADILVTLLDTEYAAHSVPSKVLTYHCAGRALLAAVPAGNPAATLVRRAGSGIVVDPSDEAGFTQAAMRLLNDPALRSALAARARKHAEAAFDIGAIADRFEIVLQQVPVPRPRMVAAPSSLAEVST